MKIFFTLSMRVISKKNSKRLIMRGGRKFFVPSEAYERFKLDAGTEIYKAFNGKRPMINKPMMVDCTFYIKGKYKVDADNLYTSILDILQDHGIIADDDLVIEGHFKKYTGHNSWHTEIEINY